MRRARPASTDRPTTSGPPASRARASALPDASRRVRPRGPSVPVQQLGPVLRLPVELPDRAELGPAEVTPATNAPWRSRTTYCRVGVGSRQRQNANSAERLAGTLAATSISAAAVRAWPTPCRPAAASTSVEYARIAEVPAAARRSPAATECSSGSPHDRSRTVRARLVTRVPSIVTTSQFSSGSPWWWRLCLILPPPARSRVTWTRASWSDQVGKPCITAADP